MDQIQEQTERQRIGRPPLPSTLAGFHRCYICKELKPLSEFYKEKKRPDGHGFRCKACNKIWKKKHWQDYKVRYREELSRRGKERYAVNREERLAHDKARRLVHGAKWNATERAKHAANPVPNMLANAKSRARRRNIEFDLRREDVVVPTICPALGIPLVVTPGRTTDNSPSLDRIDNAKGYVRGNVVVVSFKANTIKSNATIEELRSVVAFYGGLK